MANNIQSIRGMHDVLPDQTPLWQFLEQRIAAVLARYGYREIRMPILEVTELFKLLKQFNEESETTNPIKAVEIPIERTV